MSSVNPCSHPFQLVGETDVKSLQPKVADDIDMNVSQQADASSQLAGTTMEEGEIVDDSDRGRIACDSESEPSQSKPGKTKDDDDKLVEVSNYNRNWHGKKYPAKFLLEDGTTIPSSDAGIFPWFRIEGVPVDPKVTFLLRHDDPSEYPRQVIIGSQHIHKLEADIDTVTSDKDHVLVDCVIKADAFVPVYLSQTDKDEELDKLRRYMCELPGIQKGIKFRLFVPSDKWNNCNLAATFEDFLRHKNPWAPYRSPARNAIMTQAGQLVTRASVKERWENGTIIKIPVVNSFYSLDEAAVKLIYGARLEYCVSIMRVQRLMGVTHKIVLLQFDNFFLGAITFGKLRNGYTPYSLLEQPPTISDGTPCKITVFSENHVVQRFLKLQGITAPRGIDISITYDLVVILSPVGDVRENFTFGTNNQYDCKVSFDINDTNLKAQINAVNTLRTEKFSRWHPILLNTDYASLPTVNVFEGIPPKVTQAAYRKLSDVRKWNKQQARMFELLFEVPGNGFAFIEGIFGCGNTLVQASLAKLICGLGLRVLMVAPTNAALQAVSKAVENVAPDLQTLLLVFSGATSLQQFEAGVKDTGEFDTEAALFHLLRSEAASRASRYHVVEKHSLDYHIDTLIRNSRKEEIEFQFTYQEGPNMEPESYGAIEKYLKHKDVDFSALLRAAADDEAKIKDIKKTRGIFRKALITLKSTVVSESEVLLCTNQLSASDLVRHKFGANGKGIVIIADEDGQTLEPTAWLPVALLRHADKVKAVLRCGDRLQLPPLAISAFSNFSEFAPQVNRSLFVRFSTGI